MTLRRFAGLLLFIVGISLSGRLTLLWGQVAIKSGTTTGPVLAIEIIDAQAFTPNAAPGIDNDPASDVDAKTWYRTGAFTDGASVLVIRIKNAGETPITLSLKLSNPFSKIPQTAEYLGSLHAYRPERENKGFPALPAPNHNLKDPTTASPGPTSNGSVIAFYRPPNNFLFGASDGSTPKDTQSVVITVTAGSAGPISKDIALWRPVTVLSHGVKSDSSAMATIFDKIGDDKLMVDNLDWSDLNTSGYDVVLPRLKNEITNNILKKWRDKGIAATRVDWVGHSMGGALAKWCASDIPQFFSSQPLLHTRDGWADAPDFVWTNAQKYARPDNFGIGDLRRLVTLDSPLAGSEIGEKIYTRMSFATLHALSIDLFHTTAPDAGCAAYDLGSQAFTSALLKTKHPQVSWYPIVGKAAPADTDRITGSTVGSIATVLFGELGNLGETYSAKKILLDNNVSDYIVLITSQNDGQPTAKQLLLDNMVHTEATDDSRIMDPLMKVLDRYYKDSAQPGYTAGCDIANSSF